MSELSRDEINFLRLVQRSEDIGDGWRQVSDILWQLVERFDRPELIDKDADKKRVRLSERGLIVAGYL